MVQTASTIAWERSQPARASFTKSFARLLLSLLLLLTLPAAAHAQTTTGTTADGFIYQNAYPITITGYSGTGGAVTIPATINGKPVAYIGMSAFSDCSSLTSVTIASGVTSIGSGAFSNCANITSVMIPSGVTSIQRRAFSGCSSLTSVTIPDSVTNLGGQAFYGCSSLTSATIPSSVTSIGTPSPFDYCDNLTAIAVDPGNSAYSSADGVVFNKDQTTIIQFPGGRGGAYAIPGSVKKINGFAFHSARKLTSVTIPNGVTSIEYMAFEGCSGLTNMTIPASVTSISFPAFDYCTAMTSINVDTANPAFSSADGVLCDKSQSTLLEFPCGRGGSYVIPNTVTSIGPRAFIYCRNLTSVVVPESVTSIGEQAFYYCSSLKSAFCIGNCPSIGLRAFDYTATGFWIFYFSGATGFGSASYPAQPNNWFTWTTSGSAATITKYNGTQDAVSIPSRFNGLPVTGIANDAFLNCTVLTSVTISSSVTSIGSNAFQYCNNLTSVKIPSSVISIGAYAFHNCGSLNGVTIPSSVTSIGAYAFQDCNNMTSVTIPSSVTSIGTCAFRYCISLKNAFFLGNSPAMGSSVFGSAASGFTVYYFSDKTTYTSPTWNGYTAAGMGLSSPVTPWLILKGFPYDADLDSTPNRDGVPLLMAYAFNLDPTRNQSRNIPQPMVVGNNMSLTYYAASAGITYTVETSPDLKTWDSTGVTVSGPDANNCYTATVPIAGPPRFMRLNVVR